MEIEKPVILCLTNTVTINWVANVLLACGAAPIMSHDAREIDELLSISKALYINIGTLSAPFTALVTHAVNSAKQIGIPIVLDPVGAGASALRTNTAKALLPYVDVLRGNASEILALAEMDAQTQGVEAVHTTKEAMSAAVQLAKENKLVVAISGKEDFITNGYRRVSCQGGSDLSPYVTGMGCALTAMIAACCARMSCHFDAAHAAVTQMNECAEKTDVDGPGTFQAALLDTLFSEETYYV
ncbi:MAG: hydroxyethylthiazole kinase [marine bacterium B5-7]|nr:MAG: hydroxyethylthiazole kinase [marine bacterium B5-7]